MSAIDSRPIWFVDHPLHRWTIGEAGVNAAALTNGWRILDSDFDDGSYTNLATGTPTLVEVPSTAANHNGSTNLLFFDPDLSYNDGDVVLADPNGFGDWRLYTYDSGGIKPDANLASIWDSTQTAANQGSGLGTGVFRAVGTYRSILHYGHSGQTDWTDAFNNAIADMVANGYSCYVDPVDYDNWYQVGDLNFIPNEHRYQVRFYGATMKTSVIQHIGTGRLFRLGDPSETSSNSNQDWSGFALKDIGITTRTGTTAVHVGWRYSGVKLEDCQIEGFSGYGVSNIDADGISEKAWSLVISGCHIVYCGIGVANFNHALSIINMTRIYFCDINVQIRGGAANRIEGSDLSACKTALIDCDGDGTSLSLNIDDNYIEYGYDDGSGGPITFGPDNPGDMPERPLSLDGSHSLTVDGTAVGVRIRNMGIGSLTFTKNGVSAQGSQTVFDIDMNPSSAQRHILNLQITENSIRRDAGGLGTILDVSNYAGESYENITYTDNYTSNGTFANITNLNPHYFRALQVSFNNIRARTVSATNSELDDASAPINTVDKEAGKMVWQDAGTPRALWAQGPLPTDLWVSHSGAAIRTPQLP